MAKKRGGIAGFYDRNKSVIKPVATGLAGMFGTPALGAAVGAAFGGLDREGKSGIGFDVKGAAKGGLSGYAAGSAGQALGKMAGIGKVGALEKAGGRLGSLFTGGSKAVSPVDKLTGAPEVGLTAGTPSPYGAVGSMKPSIGGAAAMPGPASSASMYGNIPAPKMGAMPKIATQVADPVRSSNPLSGLGSALKSKEGLAFAGNAMQAGANIMGSQSQAAQQEREYEDQQRRLQAQAEIMAMFAPQMAGNLGMTNFGAYKSPYSGR